MKGATPTFEQWAEYCFTQGYADFQSCNPPHNGASLERERRFVDLPPETIGQFLIKLLQAPAFLSDQYSDEQIAEGIWFVFGHPSSFFLQVWDDAPLDLQVECMSAASTAYTELFDKLCNLHQAEPDTNYTNLLPLDIAVCMIWDMSGLEAALMGVNRTSHLVEPGFDVLRTILAECRTSSCLKSALHGLGHLYHDHADQVAIAIDAFLEARPIPDWLKEYAIAARIGAVQ